MEQDLRTRFEKNGHRHAGMDWATVWARLQAKPAGLRALAWMEETGGEPDVVGYDAATGEFLFVDCSPETPAGRTSTCYDAEALRARKEAKPRHSAVAMAMEAGVEEMEVEFKPPRTPISNVEVSANAAGAASAATKARTMIFFTCDLLV